MPWLFFLAPLEEEMKRVHFIIAAAIGTLIAPQLARRAEAKPSAAEKWRKIWSERLSHDLQHHHRRYEHWIHGNHCMGVYDRTKSAEEVAARKARCAKICGLCRYIYSLDEWPVKHYRRPPQSVLDVLEEV